MPDGRLRRSEGDREVRVKSPHICSSTADCFFTTASIHVISSGDSVLRFCKPAVGAGYEQFPWLHRKACRLRVHTSLSGKTCFLHLAAALKGNVSLGLVS